MSVQHLPVVRELTGIGHSMLINETEANPAIILGIFKLEKNMTKEELSKRLDESLCLYYRFKSILISNKYFKEIDNFTAIKCVSEYLINEDIFKQFGYNTLNDNTIKLIIYKLLNVYTNKLFIKTDKLPLWRLHIYNFKLYNKEFSVIIMRIHHVIMDGVTFGLLWFKYVCDNNENTSKGKGKAIKLETKQHKNRSKNFIQIIAGWIFLFFGFIALLWKYFSIMFYKQPKKYVF